MTPRTRIEIDPNVRVRGNGTYAGFEDVTGDLVMGDGVEVFESESGLHGTARITEIDVQRQLVYLSLEWSQLTDEPLMEAGEPPAADASLASGIVMFPARSGLSGRIYAGSGASSDLWGSYYLAPDSYVAAPNARPFVKIMR